jgi:YegS/Rv2252/BmrU family lipid kinase
MKIIFIVNPIAGKGHALKMVPEIESVMGRLEKIEYSIQYTEKPGHATEIARHAAEQGADIVFAVGGDGTVNEVANGLISTNTALAVLPGGSGNDFMRSIGISGDIENIITGAVNGTRKLIDVGLINGRYFINISSVGFDAEVVLATQQAKKLFLSGSAAYVAGLITTILTKRPSEVRIILDGKELKERILLIAVANGKYYGGGMKAAPDAVLDDGLFDICLIRAMSKPKMLVLFPQFMKGKHEKFKEVSFYRSRNVYVESVEPISVNVDGEVFRDTKVRFELVKGGLAVAVPGTADFV